MALQFLSRAFAGSFVNRRSVELAQAIRQTVRRTGDSSADVGALPKARSPPRSHPEQNLGKKLDRLPAAPGPVRLLARRVVAGRTGASHRPLSEAQGEGSGTKELFSRSCFGAA